MFSQRLSGHILYKIQIEENIEPPEIRPSIFPLYKSLEFV